MAIAISELNCPERRATDQGKHDDYADLTVLQGATPTSFRRAVATQSDEIYDAEAAMNQLGHTSKTITERHYINRKLVVPDYRAATERLAPDSETSGGPALVHLRLTPC